MKVPEKYRERIFDVLRGDIEAIDDDHARAILETIALADLFNIEPILEEMLDEILKNSTRPN